MRKGRRWWLLVLGLGFAGCDERICQYGVYPPNGATDVRSGDSLSIRANALPADLPSLDGGITLVDESTDETVPLQFDVDFVAAQVWATPLEPLIDGRVYLFRGIVEQALSAHWSGSLAENSPSFARYFVGDPPTIRYEVQQQDGSLQVGWSAPIDLATVSAAVEINGGASRVVGVRLGNRDGRLMVIDTDLGQTLAADRVAFAVREGVRTVRGESVPPVGAHVFGTIQEGAHPNAYDGMSFCGF